MGGYYTPVIVDPYPPNYAGQAIEQLDYLDPLIIRREINAVKMRDGKDNADFIVGAPYRITYRLEGDQSPRVIEVPRGMLTDLSSVPWWGRWLVSQVGPHLEASIIHDFLYIAWQDLDAPDGKPREPSQADKLFADRILLAGMQAVNVTAVQRQLIYGAVRAGGWPVFSERDEPRYYDFWS